MVATKVVPVTIALPKVYKDLLRQMALEESLKNPDQQITTVSQLGRKILCNFLRKKLEELSNKDA